MRLFYGCTIREVGLKPGKRIIHSKGSNAVLKINGHPDNGREVWKMRGANNCRGMKRHRVSEELLG